MDEIYCKMDTYKTLDYSIDSNCTNISSFRLHHYVNFDALPYVPEASNVIIDSSHPIVNTLPLSSMFGYYFYFSTGLNSPFRFIQAP